MTYTKQSTPPKKYTFFSIVHRTFSRMHPMLDHKTSVNKFSKTEIIQNISSITME